MKPIQRHQIWRTTHYVDYYMCIDVDPLLEQKDKEIERLKSLLEEAEADEKAAGECLANYADGIDMQRVVRILDETKEAKKQLEQRDKDSTKEFVELGITISNQLERITALEQENAKLRLRLFDEGRIKESEQPRS